MKKKISKEEIDKRLLKTGNKEISIDYSTYISVNKKCKFIDSEYGEWWALPTNVLSRKSRHPKRASKEQSLRERLPIETIKQRLFMIFGDMVKIDESTYTFGREKARFIDSKYGEFWCRVDAITTGYRKGHPMRGRKNTSIAQFNDPQKMKEKIKLVWGDTVELLEYKGYSCKNLFKDIQYGEWEASFQNVLNGHGHPMRGIEKQRQTMLLKYGVESSSQVREFALKGARSSNRRVIVKHWKTNEDVICTASYEFAVINQLNELKIDYKTQISIPLVIDGLNRIYFVDLYLPERNVYIEIKGFFREPGRKKWEEFIKKYPNSELWRLKEVKNFTGKTEYRITKDFKLALKKNENTI